MPHPHQALLDEFKLSIDRLPITVPQEIIDEARKLHAELLADPEASESKIEDALILIGKKEYPYRRAYNELAGTTSAEHRVELILDHLDASVKEKVQSHLQHGVTIDELVKSSMFETDFTPEERYQVEDGMLHAVDHLEEEAPAKIEEHQAEYDKLVETWKEKEAEMEGKIAELKALADVDKKWKDEILDKVRVFEMGFAITERDPDLVEIEKEIEYWKGTLSEEGVTTMHVIAVVLAVAALLVVIAVAFAMHG